MPEKKEHKVIVYSTPTCPYCHAAKDYLKEHKVKFEDVDVSKDQKAAEDMIEKSGQMGVPVIIVDNKVVIVGFDRDALKKALGLKD
jgi:glutaredoxin-like YruB-family protein